MAEFFLKQKLFDVYQICAPLPKRHLPLIFLRIKGSISWTFYAQLLSMQIQKAQKILTT
jgi:hypothetical protein